MNRQFFISSFKKEIWEFNKILFWVPLIVAIMMIVAPVIQLILLKDYQVANLFQFLEQVQQVEDLEHFDKVVLGAITGLFVPFIMVAFLVQCYYFITCLFDERRDLSVYFWRSLPVSDASTVGVKLATGALVIPGIFMLGATLAAVAYLLFALVACIVLSVGYDISLWHLWGNAELFSNLVSVWLSLLPYALWLFPLYAWLMLVSMFAKKAPFLWAVIPLVAVLLIEAFVVEYFHLRGGFFREVLFDYFTFTDHLMPHGVAHSESSKQVLATTLFTKVEFGGTLLGGTLIYLTYWLRTNKSQP